MASRLRERYERYEHQISIGSIALGFLFDSVTLFRIDLPINHILLFTYLSVIAFGIFSINLFESGRARWLEGEWYAWLFIAMQFSFGGLFGRFFLYYFHAGTASTSWPFLLLLFALLVSNEFSKKHYTRLVLQLVFFFLALYLYLIFYIPILLGKMSDGIFIFSGIISLGILHLFVRMLDRLVPTRVRDRRTSLRVIVTLVFCAVNLLYFANLIPPLPLALHDAGVYHSIARTENGYEAVGEPDPFFEWFRGTTIHLRAGENAYIFSAVFAPTHFGTSIVHRWERYNADTLAWEEVSRVRFPIVGGQDYGFRGYSEKTNPAPGRWRVSIETPRGQPLGRVEFSVERVTLAPLLVTEEL